MRVDAAGPGASEASEKDLIDRRQTIRASAQFSSSTIFPFESDHAQLLLRLRLELTFLRKFILSDSVVKTTFLINTSTFLSFYTSFKPNVKKHLPLYAGLHGTRLHVLPTYLQTLSFTCE